LFHEHRPLARQSRCNHKPPRCRQRHHPQQLGSIRLLIKVFLGPLAARFLENLHAGEAALNQNLPLEAHFGAPRATPEGALAPQAPPDLSQIYRRGPGLA